MEHLQHGMQRKWERHYKETRSNISVGLIILGIAGFLALNIIWPQKYSQTVFDSRLRYYLILDIEDYWTCSNEYDKFVIDDPIADIRLFSFYVFNITNPLTTIQRGYKPDLVETGPYGYEMHSYKYNIYFQANDSSTVSYQEYSILKPVTDMEACKRMFYRMDKDTLLEDDPCSGSNCFCQDPTSMITVLNPLYVKLINEESANSLLARYSSEIFATQKKLLLEDFVEATKAHAVPFALQEIYVYRNFMQVNSS
jgi:hypothetical protein